MFLGVNAVFPSGQPTPRKREEDEDEQLGARPGPQLSLKAILLESKRARIEFCDTACQHVLKCLSSYLEISGATYRVTDADTSISSMTFL